MNSINVSYPVIGSSALQAKGVSAHAAERIIEFPGKPLSVKDDIPKCVSSGYLTAFEKIMHSEAVLDLRLGTARGIPFNKMKKSQSLAAGLTCFVVALVAIFIGV
ncbi:MAG: hypothetical protein RR955_00290 [Raoultibacter sp.]